MKMQLKIIVLLSVILLGCYLFFSPAVQERQLLVFSGAALQPALEEIAVAFYKRTGVRVLIDFDSTGKSMVKAKISGKGDIILGMTAELQQMGAELLATEGARILAYRVPAICFRKASGLEPVSLSDLASPGLRLGFGRPDTVMVGRLAFELFEQNGLSDSIRANTLTIFDNYSRLLAAISMGSVDASIAWLESGRAVPEGLEFRALAPESIVRVLSFSAFKFRGSEVGSLADSFLSYLAEDEAQSILTEWGYSSDLSECLKLAPHALVDGVATAAASF